MPTPPSSPNSVSEAAALAGIRRAAEETLAAWPEARAAVLYGSRARGDYLPTSDWDVAFITRSDGDRVTAIPAGLPIEALPYWVQALALPEGLARRKALSIGHVGRGVVRDGRLLAGRWTRPQTVGEPTMEQDKYGKLIDNASRYIQNAATEAATVGRAGRWRGGYAASDRFVTQTASAAEHLAKAMLGRQGIDHRKSHDVDLLANQAAMAGYPDLAKNVAAMNGFTREDHIADYEGANPASIEHAVRRLPVVLRQLGRELASAAGDPKYAALFPDLAQDASDFATVAEDTVRQAIARDGGDLTPPSTHKELAPLVEARHTFVAELLLLRGGLRSLIPGPGGGRGKGRSVVD